MSKKTDTGESGPTPIPLTAERRRYPRIEVLERIHGQVVALNVPLTLLDMSQSGFSIKSSFAFPLDAIHDFRFVTSNREPVVLRARVVRTLRTSGGESAPSYATGLEFAERGKPEIDQAIDSLINILKIVSVLVPTPPDSGDVS